MNEEKNTQSVEETHTTVHTTETDGPGRPIWITLLAVAGILAVIAALGMGILELASRGSQNVSDITTGLGNLFGREERIVLTAEESTINAGDEVEVGLEHRNRDSENEGAYSIEFECEEGVSVSMDGEEAPCNEAIDLGEELPASLLLSIATTESRYTDLPIVVRFDGSEAEVESDTLVTVVNTDIDSTVTTGEEEQEEETPEESEGESEEEAAPTYVTVKRYGGRYSDPNGTADLHVSIDAVGIDRNDDFRSRERVDEDDRAAVAFTVTNTGTKETGAWFFSAILPTGEPYYFQSDTQASLLPGDRIEFILAFDDIEGRGKTSLYIHADPIDNVRELSSLNNVAEAVFNVR